MNTSKDSSKFEWTIELESKFRQDKIKLHQENEEYLRTHPELKQILHFVTTQVLIHKPSNILDFTSTLFRMGPQAYLEKINQKRETVKSSHVDYVQFVNQSSAHYGANNQGPNAETNGGQEGLGLDTRATEEKKHLLSTVAASTANLNEMMLDDKDDIVSEEESKEEVPELSDKNVVPEEDIEDVSPETADDEVEVPSAEDNNEETPEQIEEAMNEDLEDATEDIEFNNSVGIEGQDDPSEEIDTLNDNLQTEEQGVQDNVDQNEPGQNFEQEVQEIEENPESEDIQEIQDADAQVVYEEVTDEPVDEPVTEGEVNEEIPEESEGSATEE